MNILKKLNYIGVLFITSLSISEVQAQKDTYPFENEIRAYKQQDEVNRPEPGGFLFIGSSSIRMWDDLEQRFPDKPIIKRGVGGCELSHVVDYYTPSILFPYKPSKIFIYAGENDIASNKSADDVAKNFERLWHMIRLQLPETKIYFMAIKPSNSRTKHFSEFNKANLLVKQFLKGKPLSKYIDMASPVLNKAGQPDSALFKNDQLHLNNKGYDKWHKKLKSYL